MTFFILFVTDIRIDPNLDKLNLINMYLPLNPILKQSFLGQGTKPKVSLNGYKQIVQKKYGLELLSAKSANNSNSWTNKNKDNYVNMIKNTKKK